MKIYQKNGFHLLYPDGLKAKGETSHGFELINPKTKVFCGIQVEPESWTMEYTCDIRFRSSISMHKKNKLEGFEVLREDTLPPFFGSVESLYKFLRSDNKISYIWCALLPIDGRILLIGVAEQELENIDKLWKPIIETLTFNNDEFMEKKKAAEIEATVETYNWKSTGLLKKSKHFQHVFNPENAILSCYDSSMLFIPDLAAITEETVAAGIIKKENSFTLLLSDALDIVADFYYCHEIPDMSQLDCEQAAEGVINITSGKLCVQASELPEVEINFKPGLYRFLVCFKAVEPEEDRQKLLIYFYKNE